MPTSTPEPTSMQTSSDSTGANLLARQPLIWLLVILALALGLRAVKLNDGLQRDEFGALYAVAERKTASTDVPPSSADPLVPVAGLGEVSNNMPRFQMLAAYVILDVAHLDWPYGASGRLKVRHVRQRTDLRTQTMYGCNLMIDCCDGLRA